MAAPIKINLPDGDWTCNWVGEFRYDRESNGNGIAVSCGVTYAKRNVVKELRSPLNSLYRTIIGSRLNVSNGVGSVTQNAALDRDTYYIKVTQEFASNVSERFYRHLHLNKAQYYNAHEKSDPAYLKLIQNLRLPLKFGYTYAHCLPGKASNKKVDYFILPSYEVLRYFFLLGSSLPTKLLSYFTGKKEQETQSINDLVAHPTGLPLIVSYEGRKTAFLQVIEGLSWQEICSLARIAFIPAAYTCIEMAKESLLVSSLEGNYTFRTLQTILPQNEPFEIAACGRKFDWHGKTYVLVDQIYDVKEKMPFDHLAYSPLVDHRRLAIRPGPENEHTPRPGTASKPASPYQLTAIKPGDAAQPATIIEQLETGYFFPDKPVLTGNKLPKKEQDGRYPTTLTTKEHELLSLLEQGVQAAEAGRTNAFRQDKHKVYGPQDAQVKPVFDALTLLKEHTCSYFNLDIGVPAFSSEYHLNHARFGSPYRILLCLLKPKEMLNRHLYFAWAGTIRYAIFYAADLKPIEPAVLVNICTNIFNNCGVTVEFEDKKFDLYRQYVKSYAKYNPAGSTAEALVSRIENKLADIRDDNTTFFR